MSPSLRLLLLGIALIVFGLAFQGSMEVLILRAILGHGIGVAPQVQLVLASVFPLAGLIVAFVGFFKRDQP